MELNELIESLAGHDKKAVADALKEHAQDHYQAIYQRGFSTAHGEAQAKIAAKDAEITAYKESAEQQEAKIKELQNKAPDAEELRNQYEERLQTLQREKNEAVEAVTSRITELHKTRFKAELKAALIVDKIDPDYASHVLVSKYDGRIKAMEDGTIKVMSDDDLTPLQAPAGELASVFAKQIKATVDPKWITSTSDTGGGASSGKAGGGGSEWDRYRQQARDRQNGHSNPEAAERKLARL